MSSIRFMKHYVTDGTTKARVNYSYGESLFIKGKCVQQKHVTLYAKGFMDGPDLHKVFGKRFQDNTNVIEDYHEKGKVRINEGEPGFEEAKTRAV